MRYLKDEEPIRVFLLLIAVFILYSFIFQPLGFLNNSSLQLNDYFFSLSRSHRALPGEIKDIIVVAVDNQSIEKVGLKWPWKRSLYAQLLNKISPGKPKAVFFDFAFAGKSEDEAADLLFAQAIKNAGNVILAGYTEDGKYSRPYELFVSAARAVGLVDKKPDKDARVRSAKEVREINEPGLKFEYGIETKLLALSQGAPLEDIAYLKDRIVISRDLSFPVGPSGYIPINYSVNYADFTTIPAVKILGDSFVDPSVFKDKVVMLGMTATVGHDVHLTPVERLPIPGIYVNAYTLLMLASRNFIKYLPYAYENPFGFRLFFSGFFREALPYLGAIFISLFFMLVVGFISWSIKPRDSLLIVAGMLWVTVFIYSLLATNYSFRMDIFSLIFLIIISFLIVEAYKYISLIIESEKIKQLAIVDPATGIYTQRYFQLFTQSILARPVKKQSYFFGLVYIEEFSKVRENQIQSLPRLIRMLSDLASEYLGKKMMIAQYDDYSLSFWVRNDKRKQFSSDLSAFVAEIAGREFILDKEPFKLSVRCAAVDFPRERLKGYTDLVLTCETLFKRLPAGQEVPLVMFDAKIDKVVRATLTKERAAAKVMPKGELGYISLDLEARNKELEVALQRVREEEKKNEQYYFQTMHSLVKALEEKDPYTAGHSERVGFYATELAAGLNLPKKEIEAVNKAAYLHDIGKIGLPDRILHKRERLTDEDFAYIKRHMSDGAKILEGLPFFAESVPYILYHHERYDGKGYPHGLSGDMIPRGAQLIAVADSFDAMTTGRGYNQPLLLPEAIAELKKSSGIQFNPAYAAKFIELLEEKKIRAI